MDKAILFIAMMSWGPHYPDVPAKAHVLRIEMPSAEACEAEVESRHRERDFAGKVGNLPGYRRVLHSWCEPAVEPWPMFDIDGRRIQ